MLHPIRRNVNSESGSVIEDTLRHECVASGGSRGEVWASLNSSCKTLMYKGPKMFQSLTFSLLFTFLLLTLSFTPPYLLPLIYPIYLLPPYSPPPYLLSPNFLPHYLLPPSMESGSFTGCLVTF